MCVITGSVTAGTVAAIIAAAISTATSTAITFAEMESQRKTASMNVHQMEQQAKQAEQEAAYERQKGIEEARKQRLSAILKMGEDKAHFAAGNIAMTSSTVLNLEEDTKLNSELDALTTLRDSEHKARSYEMQAGNLYDKASLIPYNYNQAKINAGLKLYSSGVKSASSFKSAQ